MGVGGTFERKGAIDYRMKAAACEVFQPAVAETGNHSRFFFHRARLHDRSENAQASIKYAIERQLAIASAHESHLNQPPAEGEAADVALKIRRAHEVDDNVDAAFSRRLRNFLLEVLFPVVDADCSTESFDLCERVPMRSRTN